MVCHVGYGVRPSGVVLCCAVLSTSIERWKRDWKTERKERHYYRFGRPGRVQDKTDSSWFAKAVEKTDKSRRKHLPYVLSVLLVHALTHLATLAWLGMACNEVIQWLSDQICQKTMEIDVKKSILYVYREGGREKTPGKLFLLSRFFPCMWLKRCPQSHNVYIAILYYTCIRAIAIWRRCIKWNIQLKRPCLLERQKAVMNDRWRKVLPPRKPCIRMFACVHYDFCRRSTYVFVCIKSIRIYTVPTCIFYRVIPIWKKKICDATKYT